jgi:hypothetical protein
MINLTPITRIMPRVGRSSSCRGRTLRGVTRPRAHATRSDTAAGARYAAQLLRIGRRDTGTVRRVVTAGLDWHYSGWLHGLTMLTPRGWKCLVLRVAMVSPVLWATAAMSASSSGAWSGTG